MNETKEALLKTFYIKSSYINMFNLNNQINMIEHQQKLVIQCKTGKTREKIIM